MTIHPCSKCKDLADAAWEKIRATTEPTNAMKCEEHRDADRPEMCDLPRCPYGEPSRHLTSDHPYEQKDSAAEQRCVKCGHQGDLNEYGFCQTQIGARNWEPCRCKCSFSEAAAIEGVPERIFIATNEDGSMDDGWEKKRWHESDIEYVRVSVDEASVRRIAEKIWDSQCCLHTAHPPLGKQRLAKIITTELRGKQ